MVNGFGKTNSQGVVFTNGLVRHLSLISFNLLNKNQQLILGELNNIEKSGLCVTKAINEIALKNSIPLSTARWNIQRLGELKLVTFGSKENKGKRIKLTRAGTILLIHEGGEVNGSKNKNRNPAVSKIKEQKGLGLSRPKLLECEIELTKACNLKCIHCYASAGKKAPAELETQQILSLIQKLADGGLKELILTGGEPLLRKDLLDIVGFAKSKGIKVRINSNGMLISEKMAKELSARGVKKIQISLDGLEETHNFIRGNSKSFQQAINAIRLCQKNGIKVEVSTVLLKHNKNEITKLVELTKKLKVEKHAIDLFIPRGRALEKNIGVSLEEYTKIVNSITNVKKTRNAKELIPRCGFGFRRIVINAEGNIQPCPVLSEIVLGNIAVHDPVEIFYSKKMDEIRKAITVENVECFSCEHKMKCLMGCRARAKSIQGSLSSADPVCCALFKKNN